MKFLSFFLVIILFNTIALSNEKIPVKYIDLSFIVNNSIVGKKIKDLIISENEKLKKEHNKIEKKLEKQKNDVLSKQNILSEVDFKKEVDKHQANVKNYHSKKKQDIDKLNKKNLNISKNLMIKIDKIVIDYAKANSIDLLLKKDTLIVSNSKLDITKNILEKVDKTIKKID